MKITFEKCMRVREVLKIFEEFIMEEAEGYPLLKNNMSVNITLKNDINQISPNNERDYSFGELDCEKIQNEEKRYADFRLHEEWNDFSSNSTCSYLTKEIESARKYIEEADAKKRKPENVEKRKSLLLEYGRKLVNEKERLESLKKYIDLVSENKVKYKYTEYLPGEWSKSMIFEFEETYIFEYNPDVICECELRKIDIEGRFGGFLL